MTVDLDYLEFVSDDLILKELFNTVSIIVKVHSAKELENLFS